MKREVRTALIVLITIFVVHVVGTAGYVLIEGWGLLDSLYMTVMTIFTVGFGELYPLSRGGTVFTIFLIISGVASILYGIGAMMEFVVGGQLSGVFRRRAVRRQVQRLDGHYIICGYGRVGEAAARHFTGHKARLVVIDNDPERIAAAESDGYLTVEGDAAGDDVLEAAGIARAKGLVSALGSDAGNIFVVLSARVLNPSLLIVARAGADDAVSKLQRAGANHVVSLYGSGGKRMATLVLKPLVSDYLEVVTGGGELAFLVEEFELGSECSAIGQSIEALDVRRKTGATILAMRRASTGTFDTNPSPDTRLGAGDMIVAIGTAEAMNRLDGMIRMPEQRQIQTASGREAPAGA